MKRRAEFIYRVEDVVSLSSIARFDEETGYGVLNLAMVTIDVSGDQLAVSLETHPLNGNRSQDPVLAGLPEIPDSARVGSTGGPVNVKRGVCVGHQSNGNELLRNIRLRVKPCGHSLRIGEFHSAPLRGEFAGIGKRGGRTKRNKLVLSRWWVLLQRRTFVFAPGRVWNWSLVACHRPPGYRNCLEDWHDRGSGVGAHSALE